MSIAIVCGAHCWTGSIGGTTPAGAFGHYDAFNSNLANITKVTPTGLAAGEVAYRVLQSTVTTSTLGLNMAQLATNQLVVRCKFKFQNTLPNTLTGGVTSLFGFDNGSENLALWYRESTASVFSRSGTVSASADYPVVLDRWYLWDAYANYAANPHTLQSQITDLVTGAVTSLGTVTGGTVTTNIAAFSLLPGFFGTQNGIMDYLVTSIAVSPTPADYPLGNGRVLLEQPARDGTHSVGAGAFKITNATPIVGSETTLYQNIDDPLLSSAADYLNQTAVDGAAYLEHRPAASLTDGTDPRAVTVVAAVRNVTGTVANAMSLKLVSGANTDAMINASSLASAAHLYLAKGYAQAPGGVTWTKTLLQDLLVRFGYATSVGSSPALHGLMFETEYPAVGATISGSATAAIDETDVRAGGKQILITVYGTTWIP